MSLLMTARSAFIRSGATSAGISLVSSAINNVNDLTSVSVSVTPDGSADQMLVLMLQNYASGGTPNVTSVLANSVAMTQITGTPTTHMWIYGFLLGSSSTTQTIVSTLVGSQDILAHASVWRGVLQNVTTGFVSEGNTSGAASTQPTFTAATTVGNMVVAHVQTGTARYGTVDGTELFEQDWSTGGASAGSKGSGAAYILATTTSTTINFQNVGLGVTWLGQGVAMVAA